MGVFVTSGKPLSDEYEDLSQTVVDIVLASASRASASQSGLTGVKLPQKSKALENKLAPLFRGNTSKVLQFKKSSLKPRGLSPNWMSNIDLVSSQSVLEQAISKKLIPPLSKEAAVLGGGSSRQMTDLLKNTVKFKKELILSPEQDPPEATTTGTLTARKAKKLRLVIRRIRCIQQVGWEPTDWDGVDKILCGGLGWDTEIEINDMDPADFPTAHYRKVPQFTIGRFKRNGLRINFDDPKIFCEWNLQMPGGQWPRGWSALLMLAEQDSGEDFPELLQKIWDQIAPEVIDVTKQVVLAALAAGGLVGGGVGAIATPAAGIVAGIVAGALGAIVAYLINTLRDDVLESADIPFMISLDSIRDTFRPGSSRSDTYRVRYARTGGSGKYDIDYYWRLVY